MADHAKTEYATAEGNDYAEHKRMYQMFLGLLKWNIAAIVILLVLMYYFLV